MKFNYNLDLCMLEYLSIYCLHQFNQPQGTNEITTNKVKCQGRNAIDCNQSLFPSICHSVDFDIYTLELYQQL